MLRKAMVGGEYTVDRRLVFERCMAQGVLALGPMLSQISKKNYIYKS